MMNFWTALANAAHAIASVWDFSKATHPRDTSKRMLEIKRVEAALARHNARRDKMSDDWYREHGPGRSCCPTCYYGAPYADLVAKIERVERWLEILKSRKNPLPDRNTLTPR